MAGVIWLRLALAVALGGALPATAAAPRLQFEGGAAYYLDTVGARVRVAADVGKEATLSPDGRRVAYVQVDNEAPRKTSLWVFDARTKARRRLLRSHPTEDNTTNLKDLHQPKFSPDGRTIYVFSLAWVTSDALFRVDSRTGAHHFVAAANSLLIVRSGPYAGDLIVSEHSYHAGGGSYEQLWLLKPDGAQVMKIPGTKENSEDAGPWLAQHRWSAW